MSRRGFTLVETLVSVLILSFVVAGISGVLIAQSRASAKQAQERDLKESGRLALLEISRAVRMAGYGINPLAAFDFDRYACTTPGTGTTCPNGGRDRIDGPDEVVISWRDPTFYRPLTAIAGAAGGPWTVSFAPALKNGLKSGRIVQMLCSGGVSS